MLYDFDKKDLNKFIGKDFEKEAEEIRQIIRNINSADKTVNKRKKKEKNDRRKNK
ncbi:MAG: hypothetical protein IJT72_09505 [Lachnospiraceae bacterium]|nr:hypothetical protein [Lachnospiraceae bacterium]